MDVKCHCIFDLPNVNSAVMCALYHPVRINVLCPQFQALPIISLLLLLSSVNL